MTEKEVQAHILALLKQGILTAKRRGDEDDDEISITLR